MLLQAANGQVSHLETVTSQAQQMLNIAKDNCGIITPNGLGDLENLALGASIATEC